MSGEEESGTASIPAPRDGAEYVGGAAPGPGCREAPDIRRCSEAGPSRGRGRIKFLPQRLRKELYAEALRLASRGLGYKRITRELLKRFGESVSRSTLSYWVRGLSTPYYRRFPSDERLRTYYSALRLHAEGYGCKRIAERLRVSPSTVKDWVAGRCSPLGPEPPEIPTPRPRNVQHPRRIELKPSPELAYVIGVVLGDGTATRGGNHGKVIALKAKDEEFVREFARCITKILMRESPVKVRLWEARGLFEAKASSATLYALLRKPVDLDRLKRYIEHCDRCAGAFLRGFLDSEGCINNNGHNDGYIYVYNTDLRLLRYVKKLLRRLGIESTGPHITNPSNPKGALTDPRTGKTYRRRKTCYYLYIRARSNLALYQKVGLTIERKKRRIEEYLKKHHPSPNSSLLLTISFLCGKVYGAGGIRTHDRRRSRPPPCEGGVITARPRPPRITEPSGFR